ncbi:hypothetical protein EHS39_22290 [Ensifer sp. MPMI2T]|nr:hypothetical protein EHS39_22290 [Ensifer sp. MPMI2T]
MRATRDGSISALRKNGTLNTGFPDFAPIWFGSALLHVAFNRNRLKDKNMQQFKVLQRPLRV